MHFSKIPHPINLYTSVVYLYTTCFYVYWNVAICKLFVFSNNYFVYLFEKLIFDVPSQKEP